MPLALRMVNKRSQNPEPASLNHLVHLITNGDQQAFESLYDITVQRIYTLAKSIVGIAEDAEEVTEDVFLKVWQSPTSFDPKRGSVIAWLMIICRSRALDRLRAQKRHLGSNFDNYLWPTFDNPLSSLEDKTHFAKAMHMLNDNQKQVIGLAYFRDFTHQQISDALNIPLGSVKTFARRALIELREVLQS